MKFTTTELSLLATQYMWPFIRIAALVSVAPIFGTHTVPARVKIIISLALTIIVAPILPKMEYIDPLSLVGLITVFHQILIGVAIGFIVTLIFGALIIGGQLVAQLMGLGFASMMDPQNGVSVPVIGQLYTILATLIFLGLNGHLILLDTLVGSFKSLPIGEYNLLPEKIWQMLQWSEWLFAAALSMALPAITALLLVNIAFGVMTRASPQLNIFAIGFPITILLGFVVILMTLPYFAPKVQQLFDQAFFFLKHTLLTRN